MHRRPLREPPFNATIEQVVQWAIRAPMRTIVQVEYRPGLLAIREEILQFLGNPVVSVFGSEAAKQLDLLDKNIGAILIGHGAAWEERFQLISHFKRTLPGIPVIASLRQSEKPFENADFNCPADNPPEWVRSVRQALAGMN